MKVNAKKSVIKNYEKIKLKSFSILNENFKSDVRVYTQYTNKNKILIFGKAF